MKCIIFYNRNQRLIIKTTGKGYDIFFKKTISGRETLLHYLQRHRLAEVWELEFIPPVADAG
ncbi:hypothetical protein BH11BAC4_BH11BAC4_01710 [soil metagenome]